MSDKWDDKAQEICVRWSGPAPFPPLKAAIASALRSATEEIPWLLKELDEQATILRAAVEAERAACAAIVRQWSTADELRLRCGEMTAQEVRTVLAVLKGIAAAIAARAEAAK